MKDLMTQYRDKYFGEKFRARLKELNLTQTEFSKKYHEKTGFNLSRNSPSNWANGKQYPESETIERICQVLDVSPDYFLPDPNDYESPSRQNVIADERLKLARDIGLSVDFINSLKDLSDFGNDFPLYRFQVISSKDPETNSLSSYLLQSYEVKRVDLAEAGTADEDKRTFQIVQDGNTYTLHEPDLYFLKEVQDKVSEFIQFLFYERKREMKREDEEALNFCLFNIRERETAEGPLMSASPKSNDQINAELCAIDRFRKFIP